VVKQNNTPGGPPPVGKNKNDWHDQVEEELSSYDDHSSKPFKQTWWSDSQQKENVHFTASTRAIDANTTFTVSKLF